MWLDEVSTSELMLYWAEWDNSAVWSSGGSLCLLETRRAHTAQSHWDLQPLLLARPRQERQTHRFIRESTGLKHNWDFTKEINIFPKCSLLPDILSGLFLKDDHYHSHQPQPISTISTTSTTRTTQPLLCTTSTTTNTTNY